MSAHQHINQRLKEIVQLFAKGNVSLFARSIGVSQQRLDRILKPNVCTGQYPNVPRDIVDGILRKYTQVDPVWFLSGHGGQLLDPETQYSKSMGQPYYPLPFSEGFQAFQDKLTAHTLLHFPFPPFEKTDFWCLMGDSSMMPEIQPEDLIALQEVQDIAAEISVAYNGAYGVVSDGLQLVRRLCLCGTRETSGIIVLSPNSIGPGYAKQSLSISRIERLFKVVGCVRKM
jgi:hypothetical protein